MGYRIKRKSISKQNSEIVSGSVNIQNDLIFNDTFLFQLVHEVRLNMLGF